MGFLKILTVPATVKPIGSLIFMHGSGGTGQMVKDAFQLILGKDLSFPHLHIRYITAQYQPYSLAMGESQHVWFDRSDLHIDSPEIVESINETIPKVDEVINNDIENGFHPANIILGGFSMGGCMAMHMGYRHRANLGGIIALSTFLERNSSVYKNLQSNPNFRRPPLFMAHGKDDDLVLHEWGFETFLKLQDNDIDVSYISYPGLEHEICAEELDDLIKWVNKKIPPPN